jgi:hypothetical protein
MADRDAGCEQRTLEGIGAAEEEGDEVVAPEVVSTSSPSR